MAKPKQRQDERVPVRKEQRQDDRRPLREGHVPREPHSITEQGSKTGPGQEVPVPPKQET